MPASRIPLLDFGVPDIFCSGLYRVDHMSGNNFRFVFYTEEFPGDEMRWVKSAGLILPLHSIEPGMKMTAHVITEKPLLFDAGKVQRMM
jgi:hypothetical protein